VKPYHAEASDKFVRETRKKDKKKRVKRKTKFVSPIFCSIFKLAWPKAATSSVTTVGLLLHCYILSI
jgi:hypothetical protein